MLATSIPRGVEFCQYSATSAPFHYSEQSFTVMMMMMMMPSNVATVLTTLMPRGVGLCQYSSA